MIKPGLEPSVLACEIVWSLCGLSEERIEQDFYAALEEAVTAAIRDQLRATEQRVLVGREWFLSVGPYTVRATLANIDPVLATTVSETTRIVLHYRGARNDRTQDFPGFVAEMTRYPSPQQGSLFDALVGLEIVKDDLLRKLTLLMSTHYLDDWFGYMYGNQPPRYLRQALFDRYPLLVFEGEVGSGKTALARSIGHSLSVRLHDSLALFVLNAQVHGQQRGDLARNIIQIFTEAERYQEEHQIPVLILIDAFDQVHGNVQGGPDETSAALHALIQRVDRLRGKRMAVLVTTNCIQSLDAAIIRRALASYHFERPDQELRYLVFSRLLDDVGIPSDDIERLVTQTEPRQLRGFGEGRHRYTFSDLTQRIIPRAVEEAVYDQRPLHLCYLLRACSMIYPTPETLHPDRGNVPSPALLAGREAIGEDN